MDASAPEGLKLAAFDEEDLRILSAHLQDAVGLVGEISYLPGEQRFAMIVNRFDWQDAASGRKARKNAFRRRRAGLHFNRVGAVKSLRIARGRADAVLSLLAIEFAEGDAPSGRIVLKFAGGGEIALDVECIEAGMADLGTGWETVNKPDHDLE